MNVRQFCLIHLVVQDLVVSPEFLLQLQFRRLRLHWFQNQFLFLKELFSSSFDVDFWDSLFKSVFQKPFSGSSMSSKRSTSDFVDIVMAFANYFYLCSSNRK